jgi:hypothetical protein
MGQEADTGITSKATSGTESGAESTGPAAIQPSETTQAEQNIDFIRYVLLAIKISLAGVAILAGISAIIFRLRG